MSPSSIRSPQTTKSRISNKEFALWVCSACLNDKHLFCPIRNHLFLKTLWCFYFSIFICISKKIFWQPSMFCLSCDLKETNKQTKWLVYLLPRIGMLSYWPDICHSQIHTKNELPHSAHGERHCSTQWVMGAPGDSSVHRVFQHLHGGQKFAFNTNCTGHWRQHFFLKRLANFG